MGPNGPAAASQQERIEKRGGVLGWERNRFIRMAGWERFKQLNEEYNLDWVWDYDVADKRGRGPGYRIYHHDLPFPVLSCVTKDTLEGMTETELEEFVVGCAVLSMQPVPDVWRV